MNVSIRLGAFTLPLWLAACVTINVYFPAAAAEAAADKIINRVLQEKLQERQQQEQGKKDKQSSTKPHPLAHDPTKVLSSVFIQLLDVLVPPAQAAAANINISTPAINKITASMAARHGKLRSYYSSGAIGFTRDGLVDMRNASAVPLAKRGALKRLLAQENRDRNALYQEIARANNHPEWEQDIRATFARRWIAKASSGWWYQGSSGRWMQK